MNPKDVLLESLTEEQRKTLQRDNPFIVERNTLVKNLYNKGVSIPVLVEITGIGRSSIHRIATAKHAYAKGKSRRAGQVIGDLRGLLEATKIFQKEIKRFIGNN